MSFGSDNHAGVHPEVMQAIIDCDEGYSRPYGYDNYTEKAQEICTAMFGESAHLFSVFGGTPSNILAMEPLLSRNGAILSSSIGHVNADEAGAPERILGNKILPIESTKGKITPEAIEATLETFSDEHQPVPQVLTFAQATEYGNCYSLDELTSLGECARDHSLLVHIDGARIANAAVFLKCSINDIVKAAGASSLSLGMLKNGGMFGENIIFFGDMYAKNFVYTRRNLMQLQSKMRYLSAQFIAFFENDLWSRNASHANDMAQLLKENIADIKGVTITTDVQSNGVFATIPESITSALNEVRPFHVWDKKTNEVRFMCSWETTPDDVAEFAGALRKLSETN